jgi:hypothetical protein
MVIVDSARQQRAPPELAPPQHKVEARNVSLNVASDSEKNVSRQVAVAAPTATVQADIKRHADPQQIQKVPLVQAPPPTNTSEASSAQNVSEPKSVAPVSASLPAAASFQLIDPSNLGQLDLQKNASVCVQVRKSTFPGAGDGCFATCEVQSGVLLGEYKGKVYMTSGKVPNDGAYTWKVPACDDPNTVLTRKDVDAWATCGNRNGFVYRDAQELDNRKDNPMRYVNGAWSEEQRKLTNVDAIIADRRVYYFASRAVHPGDELVIDYGQRY